jgi:VanZ family protein
VDSIPGSKRLLQYDKLAHFGMFFALSGAIYFDYYRLHKGKPNKFRWLLFGLIIPVIYGGLIEVVQEHFFSRTGEWMDFVADSLGSLSATIIALVYMGMKRKQ